MADPNVFAPTDRLASDSELSPEEQIKLYLSQTRPWIGLITVFLALAVVMMLCGGVIVQVGVSAMPVPAGELGPMGPLFRFLGLIYVVIAVVYAIPMVLLGRYTLAAGPTDLDQAALAVRYQRDFWRVIGVMTLLTILMYCAGVGTVVALTPQP